MSLSDITRHACALVESWAQQSLGLLDLRVIALLHQHPQGLRVEEIAVRLTTNPRGVWRNLVVLMDKGVIARRFQKRPAGTRGRAPFLYAIAPTP